MQQKRTRASARQGQSTWPVAYRWLATGTLAVYTAIGCKMVTPAMAQQLPGSSRPTAPRPAEPARSFEIAPGTLAEVLKSFQAVSGIHTTLATEGISSLASPGVSGIFTPHAALDRLLERTGVTWRATGAQDVVLGLKQVVSSVEVAATVSALATSSPKYSEPIRDTPQTISVVGQQTIQEQNSTTLRDALRNVAGISLAAGEGGSQGDNLTIRGFTARNDLFLDGMRDFGSYYRDPFNLQEVEVLQGPTSATFGRGSTGGVVNQAAKSPSLNRFFSGTFDGGTDLTRRATADVNLPVPALGSGAAFRLNIMGNEGNVAGRDIAENRRFGVAPSLSLGLGTPTRWTFSYFHQNGADIPDYGIPWLFNGPAPVDRHNYYGFSKGNFLRTYDDVGTVRFEHDFNEHVSVRNQLRDANYVRDAQITEPQLVAPVTLATPLSQIVINRNEISVNSVEKYLDDQLDVTMHFQTGAIHHTVVAGAELGREISDPIRPRYTGVPTTSLLNPDPGQAFSGVQTISSDVHTTANSAAGYLLDSVHLGKQWEFSGGVRWDRFNTHYTQQIAPASAFNRLDEMPSWRGAVVFKPVPIGSLYVAAGTSFNPSAESLSLSAANANLPPEKNKTYEAGTKWDVHRLSLRAALFQTEKTNAREPDPNNSLLNVLAGNQRVRGLQFEANGHITRRWEVLSSYAYLDGKVTSSQYYPAAVGAQLANVPRHTYNFWNTYRLPWHTQVGAGANFVGSRTASSTVPLDPVTGLVKQVPGYWVFNAMAEHPINEHVSLHANVYNIANRYYYDELHPAHIVLGPGRSALIGLKFKF